MHLFSIPLTWGVGGKKRREMAETVSYCVRKTDKKKLLSHGSAIGMLTESLRKSVINSGSHKPILGCFHSFTYQPMGRKTGRLAKAISRIR